MLCIVSLASHSSVERVDDKRVRSAYLDTNEGKTTIIINTLKPYEGLI